MCIATGELCAICSLERQCKKCWRHLDTHSFADINTCYACSRRHKSAVSQTFQEVSIPTTDELLTFEEFLAANNDNIQNVITTALREHR